MAVREGTLRKGGLSSVWSRRSFSSFHSCIQYRVLSRFRNVLNQKDRGCFVKLYAKSTGCAKCKTNKQISNSYSKLVWPVAFRVIVPALKEPGLAPGEQRRV